MGTGIAETVARSGYPVRVFEPVAANRPASRARFEASVARAAKAGKLDAAGARAVLDGVVYVDEMGALGDSDLVVEAVVEDREVKLEALIRLNAHVGPDVLIASNTSSIPIARLAAPLTHPERVLGLHFFSPAPVMKLVEVVRSLGTGDETIEVAESFVRGLGKAAIPTRDRAGFVVNMLLIPYLVAAIRMVEEGFATREDIDLGMKLGCGHPMGPLALCDFNGLDVVQAVCESLHEEFRSEYAPPSLLRRMLDTGWLGRKSGRGFYEYEQARPAAAVGAGA